MYLDIILALLIVIALTISAIIGYSNWLNQWRCEWLYWTWAIYEDGWCFNPVTK